MLTRRIIPCLDVASGKVIRGVKFSADKVVGDPVEMAAEYNRQGADELVFYDITASSNGKSCIRSRLGAAPASRSCNSSSRSRAIRGCWLSRTKVQINVL